MDPNPGGQKHVEPVDPEQWKKYQWMHRKILFIRYNPPKKYSSCDTIPLYIFNTGYRITMLKLIFCSMKP
jgi:hypothetical protein